MRAPEVDVLCVGYACIDINFKAPHHPDEDEKVRASAMHSCGGGPAANASVAIARLGGKARFFGHLGNDAFGHAHTRELQTEGVYTDAIRYSKARTPVAAITYKPNGARSIVDYRSSDTTCSETAITLKKFPAKVLLVDGHQSLLSLRLIEEANRLGVPTVLDAGSVHEGTRLLFNKVDYLITSENFARDTSQENDPRVALSFLDGAAPLTAVTWGADGVYWQDGDGQHHMPAFDIEPVDTTGAGDAFHGAFALGLAQKMPLEDNFRKACATGALTCLKPGARTALPTRKSVERLCNS